MVYDIFLKSILWHIKACQGIQTKISIHVWEKVFFLRENANVLMAFSMCFSIDMQLRDHLAYFHAYQRKTSRLARLFGGCVRLFSTNKLMVWLKITYNYILNTILLIPRGDCKTRLHISYEINIFIFQAVHAQQQGCISP